MHDPLINAPTADILPDDPQPVRRWWSPVATTAWLVAALAAAVVCLAVSTSALEIEDPAIERVLDDARTLTRDQEGLVLVPYHPASGSGVTIGYGYDMRDKTERGIRDDLSTVDPPLSAEWIGRLAAAAGLSGTEAEAFVIGNPDLALSEAQALSLFDATYERETDIAFDFATNPAAYAEFGVDYPAADWRRLHPAIRGVLIDLKYRGDYRPWWQEQAGLQERVAANDPKGVLVEIQRAEIFPADLTTTAPARFEARIAWMRRILGSG